MSRLFDLSNRVAVVVGGSSGIGRALALALADAGADVVATARRADAVSTVADEIEQRGRRTLRQTVDVCQRSTLEALRSTILDTWGQIDILINCAGMTARTPSVDVDDAAWQQVIDVNLSGTMRTCQVLGQPMLTRGSGSIINIASLAAFVGLFEVASYTASKAGVAGLTRALAVEWAPQGVRVNAIAPGVFRTDLNRDLLDGTARGQEFKLRTPMGRFGNIEELAGAAVFLASDAASYVCGTILTVDGGFLASGVNQ